jgi:hypothetical protein
MLRPVATNIFHNAVVGQHADLDGEGLLDNCEGRMTITIEKDGGYDFNDNVEQFVEITDSSLRTLSGFSNSTMDCQHILKILGPVIPRPA